MQTTSTITFLEAIPLINRYRTNDNGLLEQWIETTLQVASILKGWAMSYAFHVTFSGLYLSPLATLLSYLRSPTSP
jgi:hypothetical protein